MIYLLNFGAAFQKEHDVYFVATRMVDIAGDMLESDFLTNNICHTSYRYIRATKLFQGRPEIPDRFEQIDGR